MAAKSYALSKTKVREMIEEKFGTSGKVDIEDVLSLFNGATRSSTGSTTLVTNEDGDVVGKRCSYFGVYMLIEEFGKRGETYGYQSKLAESIARKAKTEGVNLKKLADEELAAEVITVSEWKERLSDIAEMSEQRVSIDTIDDAPQHFETAEDLLAAL